MAAFLSRGGSAPTSAKPFWTDRPATSPATTAGGGHGGRLALRPAGVPGAFDEMSRPATMRQSTRASPPMADAVAVLYEEAKGERRRIVPGYTGHIPGVKEVGGRSQSRAASRASVHTAKEMAEGESIPSDPVHKESLVRVEQAYSTFVLGKDMSSTLVGRNEAASRHISGYTGHVPSIRECALGQSYGAITAATLAGHTMNPKRDRAAILAGGSTMRGTSGFPYVMPRPKPKLTCDDPSLYLHYTGY